MACIQLFVFLLVVWTACIAGMKVDQPSKKFRFLYSTFGNTGSHYMQLYQSAKVLARKGHEVTFLHSRSLPRTESVVEEDFSVVTHNSRITAEERQEIWRATSALAINGEIASVWSIARLTVKQLIKKTKFDREVRHDDCDDLLGDKATMQKLREERFDLLIGDSVVTCNPILAQALNVSFVLSSNILKMSDEQGWLYGVLADPCLTSDRITSAFTFMLNVIKQRLLLSKYEDLKVKYQIRPDISMLESIKRAKMWFFNGMIPLEPPCPLQPNTVLAATQIGSFVNDSDFCSVGSPLTAVRSALFFNHQLENDVAEFLDTARDGVVLLSLGSYVRFMERPQAQMFANAFERVPYRVLWQTPSTLDGVTLGENTKIVKWLPLAHVMNHVNVKAIVYHGGINGVLESMWAALPIVGIPLFSDQFYNIDRIVAKGIGLSLDINQLTSEKLSDAIMTVVREPRFTEEALRASMIMKDLASANPPAETIAFWILHVTKFGGKHIQPVGIDHTFIQRNWMDIYLYVVLIIAAIAGSVLSFCYFCCVNKCHNRFINRKKTE